MKFFLLGYMGSGKSTIGKLFSEEISTEFIDLDELIEKKENAKISEVFKKKGEIYFRKLEREVLKELLEHDKPAVVSLGGGTPCYGDNMDLIKNTEEVKSIYLKLKVDTLTNRLFSEKNQRPVISHIDDIESLEEFIRKHLFERGFYYNQSDLVINCDSKAPEEIVEELKQKLG